MRFSAIFIAMFYAFLIAEGSLSVQSGYYEIDQEDMVPNREPDSLITIDTRVACAAKCTQDESCRSFYYGKSKCALFGDVEADLEDSPEYAYYKKCNGGEGTSEVTSPTPLTCDICPQEMMERIYVNENAAHVVCAVKTNWPQSSEECTCAGGRLVNIPDSKKQSYVEEIMLDFLESGAKLPSTWIGINGTAQGKDKPYNLKRSDGTTLTNSNGHFAKWCLGEPDCNSEVGIAIIVSKESKNGQWSDAPPTQKRAYLCEFVVV